MTRPNIWMLAFLVAGLSAAPASEPDWEWLGGRDASFTITTIDTKNKAFSIAEQRLPVWAWTDSIRRERPNGGTTKATLDDLKPGIRVRVFDGHGSSPLGFVARKIIIVDRK